MLCNRVPYPLKDGGVKAIDQLLRGFVTEGCQVTLACLNTSRHHVQIKDLPAFYLNNIIFKSVEVNTDIKPIPALYNLIIGRSYNLSRFYSAEFVKLLMKLLQENEYDIIHIEGLFMCTYLAHIRKYSKARVALRSHNIEHQIWQRLAKQCKNPFKKGYINKLAHQLERFERKQYNQVNYNVAIAKEDLKTILKYKGEGAIWIPYGLNNFPSPKAKIPNNTIGFLGSLEWMPNINGLDWFLEKIFPELGDNINLIIAGRNTPKRYFKLQNKNIKVLGEIDNVEAFYNKVDVVIVPLLSGSGMRIKVIEAMAYKKPIISTSIGAEGINYRNNENIIIQDEENGFLNAITDLIKDRDKADKIAQKGLEHVHANFDNNQLIKKLLNHYA